MRVRVQHTLCFLAPLPLAALLRCEACRPRQRSQLCVLLQVLVDVLRAMLAPKFIEELFQPQKIYPWSKVKEKFQEITHSSIMKLNETRCGRPVPFHNPLTLAACLIP